MIIHNYAEINKMINNAIAKQRPMKPNLEEQYYNYRYVKDMKVLEIVENKPDPIEVHNKKMRNMQYLSAEAIINSIDPTLYTAKSLTGSYYITNGEKFNDIDYVMFTQHKYRLKYHLLHIGFRQDGVDLYPENLFQSFRKGVCNVIVISDYNYYIKFLAATHLAQVQKLFNKEDRIRLFDIILSNEKEKEEEVEF